MNVLIRCDAGGRYGMGHMVRCVALAKALTTMGAEVVFTSDTDTVLRENVAPYPCGNIDTITHGNLNCLIVDTTFPIDESWYRWCASGLGCDTVVRIDHPHATPDTCDLLVGPCAHWDTGLVEQVRGQYGDRFLYGWEYVMLAPEVTAQQPIPYAKRRQEQIMFCAGGTDPENAREQMYQWVQDLDLDVPLYFPPLGNADAYRNGLRESALVVGFIGQTMYECAWYKTPMLCFARTPEDAKALELLEEKSGGSLHAGNMFSFYTQEKFVSKVEAVWQKNVRWPPLLDGNGTKRVAGIILGF